MLLQPLWITVLSLVQAKGNKDDRSAQAVQDEASLSPAAPRTQVGNAPGSHSVAATIRPREVMRTAITRERFCWNDHTDKSEREGRPFRGNTASSLVTNTVIRCAVCCTPG